jgi:nucleotidyltransferase substrate binding protein (TIGR01987 family)
LRDLLLAEGNADLIGSRDTLRLAFRVGLIQDGETWLRMVQDRNLTSHTYNRATAEQGTAPHPGAAACPFSASREGWL